MSEIQKRLEGVPNGEVQKLVYKMVKEEKLIISGAKRNRSYELAKKK